MQDLHGACFPQHRSTMGEAFNSLASCHARITICPAVDLPTCLHSATQARAAILVRLCNLVAGSSGVRLAVVEALVSLLKQEQPPQLPARMHAVELQAQLADILVSTAEPLSQGVQPH